MLGLNRDQIRYRIEKFGADHRALIRFTPFRESYDASSDDDRCGRPGRVHGLSEAGRGT